LGAPLAPPPAPVPAGRVVRSSLWSATSCVGVSAVGGLLPPLARDRRSGLKGWAPPTGLSNLWLKRWPANGRKRHRLMGHGVI